MTKIHCHTDWGLDSILIVLQKNLKSLITITCAVECHYSELCGEAKIVWNSGSSKWQIVTFNYYKLMKCTLYMNIHIHTWWKWIVSILSMLFSRSDSVYSMSSVAILLKEGNNKNRFHYTITWKLLNCTCTASLFLAQEPFLEYYGTCPSLLNQNTCNEFLFKNYPNCERWNVQHAASVGQRKYLSAVPSGIQTQDLPDTSQAL